MEPKMINIFLNDHGIIQMYLNSLMFIDFSINLNDNFILLCKYLRINNVFKYNEKCFNNSNSFNNFSKAITGMSLKLISPRLIDELRKNFEYSQKSFNSKKILIKKSNIINSKNKKINTIIKI